MMNYEMKSADTSSTHHYEVLKPIDSIKKKRKMNITPSRIENARGNVTLPLESPPEGGDLNRQRCKRSQFFASIIFFYVVFFTRHTQHFFLFFFISIAKPRWHVANWNANHW